MSLEQQLGNVTVRRATIEDTAVCGQICFDAFNTINRSYGFPCDFADPDAAAQFISTLFSHQRFYCVVAEIDGRIAGSNCLDERSTIAGVGPVIVDPQLQNRGVGRLLMRAVLDRADELKLVYPQADALPEKFAAFPARTTRRSVRRTCG